MKTHERYPTHERIKGAGAWEISMPTPRLIPLSVPWQIISAVPNLNSGLNCTEGRCEGCITFLAVLGESTTLSAEHGRQQYVAVILDDVVFSKFYPEFSKEETHRLNSYSWELIPEFRDENGTFKGHARRYHDQWNATDICPDPGVHTLEDSDLLASLGFVDESFKHYLFFGDDYNIEVVARSMKWQLVLQGEEKGTDS